VEMSVVDIVGVAVTAGQVAVVVAEEEVVVRFCVAQVLVVGEAPVRLQVAKRLQRSRSEGRILHLLGRSHDNQGIFWRHSSDRSDYLSLFPLHN
jgi:hypothetical protein